MNKQQLASRIWESANRMRSKIEANEYKDYILGFIFYKFLSDNEEKYLYEKGLKRDDISIITEENAQVVENLQKNLGYFIGYENLFSTWIADKGDLDISNVREALSAFDRLIYYEHKMVFEGIFDTLQAGLSKLGDTARTQTKSASDLIYLIKDIPMDKKQDYDVLGFIYEYLIGMFAANAGKKAGEFYTPHEVSVLISEIVANFLKDRQEISIYDSTSGSGSLLINIGQSVSKYIKQPNKIKYYAQELKEDTYNLTRMNLVMRGILPDNIITHNGDTLEDDWPYEDYKREQKPLLLDAVVSNPPYSQNWDSTDKENDPRYRHYGLAPKAKADYAFLLHDLYHLDANGIMCIVLPHGVLFRGGEEKEIRKNLIENNNIDCIIGLPANIFFGTGISTIIMIVRKVRKNTDVQIIDASKGFVKDGKNNKLRACDIKRIVDAVIKRENIEKYSRVVSREEIRENDYNLNIPRYVNSSEEDEIYDIYASMYGGIPNAEIEKFEEYWDTFPNLRKDLFVKESSNYSKLVTENAKEFIKKHADVKSYIDRFNRIFSDFRPYLYNELIENMEDINISNEENVLSNQIFDRFKKIPLLDKYQAYQLLDNEWNKISIDLEIIQTEGFEATKKVDPNMVIKKKKGIEKEVQEGWVGHVIPFEIVQNRFFKGELEQIEQKATRISSINSEYTDIIESLSEEDKEGIKDLLNDTDDAFVPKEVAKKAKKIRAQKLKLTENMIEYKIIKVDDLQKEEKQLRKEIKEENIKLHIETKKKIESLTDDEVRELLEIKWINPLVDQIAKMPEELIRTFSKQIQVLEEKYKITFLDVMTQTKEYQEKISSIIDELDGNKFDMEGLEEFKKLIKE